MSSGLDPCACCFPTTHGSDFRSNGESARRICARPSDSAWIVLPLARLAARTAETEDLTRPRPRRRRQLLPGRLGRAAALPGRLLLPGLRSRPPVRLPLFLGERREVGDEVEGGWGYVSLDLPSPILDLMLSLPLDQCCHPVPPWRSIYLMLGLT